MIWTCDECKTEYDDAERFTYCPHDRFLPPGILAQKDAALKILGKTMRFAHMPTGSGRRVTSVTHNGMVLLDGMSGEFAPHLFVEDIQVSE